MKLLVLLFVFLFLLDPLASWSLESGDPNGLTKDLIYKQIELTKLNASLKLYALPGIWYARRWHTVQTANNALTSSGAFLNGLASLNNQEEPQRLSKYTVGDASILRAIANFLSTAECTFEFGVDLVDDFKAERDGRDFKHVKRRALQLMEDIDELIKLRRLKIAQSTINGTNELADVSERIFEDLQTAQKEEFIFLLSQAKGLRAKKALNQSLCFFANLESGILTIIGMYGTLTDHGTTGERFRINSVAGIGDIIGGTIMAITPIASRLGALYRRRKTARELYFTGRPMPNLNLQLLQADYDNLCRLLTNNASEDDLLVKKLCNIEINMLMQRRNIYLEEKDFAIKSFIKSMFAAQSGSLTKITNGLGTVIGDYQFSYNTKARLQIIGGTALSYGCGNALATLINIERRIAEERRYKELCAEHKNPREVLANQIDKLNHMQVDLRSSL